MAIWGDARWMGFWSLDEPSEPQQRATGWAARCRNLQGCGQLHGWVGKEQKRCHQVIRKKTNQSEMLFAHCKRLVSSSRYLSFRAIYSLWAFGADTLEWMWSKFLTFQITIFAIGRRFLLYFSTREVLIAPCRRSSTASPSIRAINNLLFLRVCWWPKLLLHYTSCASATLT